MAARQSGQVMQLFRSAKKLNQEALAAMLGTDQGTICRWEKGTRVPSEEWRERIEAALDDVNGAIFLRLRVAETGNRYDGRGRRAA